MSARCTIAAFGAALFVIGCRDVLGLTPGHEGAGGQGGSGGVGGSSTTTMTTLLGGGGQGGNGGECACVVPGPCWEDTCDPGVCTPDPKSQDTLFDPVAGDCKVAVCNGLGEAVETPIDVSDANECTWDVCVGDAIDHAAAHLGQTCMTGGMKGICKSGACLVAACVPNMMSGEGESGVDCGGLCPPCGLGSVCNVNADCGPGLFCAGGHCAQRVALALFVRVNQFAVATFDPSFAVPWAVTSETFNGNYAGAVVAFDPDGRGVALARRAAAGARVAFWDAGLWGAPAPWPDTMSDPNAASHPLASNIWLPSFAATDTDLLFFAMDPNNRHVHATAKGPLPWAVDLIPEATSARPGVAGTRDHHVSFFYAPPEFGADLVERRLLGTVWSAPEVVLSGDFSDAQPATATLADGTMLLLALARDAAGEHELHFAYFSGSNVTKGVVPNSMFAAEQAPPRRFSVAGLAGGGAMLAFRNGAGLLDVRRATIDGGGAVTWETESSGPKDKVVVGTPAIAKGLAPSEAELLWAETAGSWHARLIGGAWDGGNAVPGAPSADALAIVTP